MARTCGAAPAREVPRHSWALVLCCGLILAPGFLEATSASLQSNAAPPISESHARPPRESSSTVSGSERLKSSDVISDHRHSDSAVSGDVSSGTVTASPEDSAGRGWTPALTSDTVISDSPGAWASADLSLVEVRSGHQLPVVPVSVVRARRSVTPAARGTQDTADRAQPERQARAATVLSAPDTAASPWSPEASFDAAPRTGRESKPDVNSVLSSIISLLGDNVRLVGPPADRAPDRGPNRQRPPRPDRPQSPTRINNRGPPQQFVPVKNRPAPPVKTRPAVRPYPSHLPPPLRPRPPTSQQRPPIAPYAVGIPLPERLVPYEGEELSSTVTSVSQTITTDAVSSEAPSATPTPSTVSPTATSDAPVVSTAVPPPPAPEPTTETASEAETTEPAGAAEGGEEGGSAAEEKVEPPSAAPERETTTEASPEVTRRPSAPPRPEEVTTPPENSADDAVTTTPAPPPPSPAGPTAGEPTPGAPTPDIRLPWETDRAPDQSADPTPERRPPQTPVRDPWVEIPSTSNVLSGSESSVPEFGGRPAASATPPLSVRPTSGFPGAVLDARPGVVVDATRRRPPGRPQVGRPQVINAQRLGDVFDITVSAAQGGFGGGPVRRPPRPQPPSGQPYVIPVDINQLRGPGDIITEPDEVNNVVSIDGRRTYFDLAPTDTNAAGGYQTVGAGLGLTGQPRPSYPPSGQSRPSPPSGYQPPRQWPQQPAVEPEETLDPEQWDQEEPEQWPQQAASMYPGQRRRPSPPPIRIDTCIVGDDSTCKREYNERCKTEEGVSSCHCRPGFNRLRPRTACKPVISVVMTMKVDGIGDSRLAWQAALRNPNSEVFQQLAWDAEHAISTSMAGTTMRDIYMGNKVTSFYLLRGGVALNTTVSLLDTAQTRREQVTDELQRQMTRAIRANDNLIGDSTLFVEGPSSPVPRVLDLDECEDSDQHDCDANAECSNVFGSFTCKCKSGYDDRYRTDEQKAGRYCDSCTDDYCSDRGTCQIFDGQKTCQCRGSYYGARCDIDGEVLGAALGATAAAIIIIVATFICLCKWSKRWHKGQGHTKVEMGTLGAASGYSFMKPSAAAAAHANFQMGVEERLRWAQMAEAIGHQNLYAPEPLYGGGGIPLYASQPNLPGTLQDGPASLNLTRTGRPMFPGPLLRSVTPAYSTAGDRGPMGPPMGRSARTPLPQPPSDDDRPPRPRSRGSVAGGGGGMSGSQQQLVCSSGSQQHLLYSSGRHQRPRHQRSSSRDSIYETLSPHLGGSSGGATQLLTFDPKRDDKLFEKSNSWRMAF